MEISEILHHVDHTQLKAFATWEDIEKLCDESIRYETASVCVPPSYVSRINETYGSDVNICTVIGFPLGYEVTAAKELEASQAIREGASEIDMVINIAEVKNGNIDFAEDEIKALRNVTDGHILKVIVETCYLTDEEKIAICRAVTEAGADYIKTSTGFGTAGAQMHDIELFKKYIGKEVKIKAAGGIRTRDFMEELLNAGVARLGCSSAVSLVSQVSAVQKNGGMEDE